MRRKIGGLDIHLKLDLASSSHQCFGNFHIKRVLFPKPLLNSLSCFLIDLDCWAELPIKLKNVALNFKRLQVEPKNVVQVLK